MAPWTGALFGLLVGGVLGCLPGDESLPKE